MIPKALLTRLKDILPYLLSSNQTAYVKKIISESGRLIYAVLETVSILNEKEFLVTVDIKKTFELVDHSVISCFTVTEVWFWGAFSKMYSNSN